MVLNIFKQDLLKYFGQIALNYVICVELKANLVHITAIYLILQRASSHYTGWSITLRTFYVDRFVKGCGIVLKTSKLYLRNISEVGKQTLVREAMGHHVISFVRCAWHIALGIHARTRKCQSHGT